MDKKNDGSKPRPHIIQLQPGCPIQITETEQELPTILSDEQSALAKAVGSTIHAYVKAAQQLLDGKYANIRDYAPVHLRDTGMVLILCCQDGIIIRYDTKTENQKLRIGIGYSDETLSELAPKLSESAVYCHMEMNFESTVPQTGPQIRISKVDGDTGEETDVLSAKIGFHTVVERPAGPFPAPPSKPYCLLSVRNHLELGLVGELLPEGITPGKGKRFVTRTAFRLPVGWECIEIFPFADPSHWKPEFADTWAENDLLAAVVAHQLREAKFTTLDPNATARRQFSNLLTAYEQLLDSDPEREEELQVFLKEHPVLLCPAYAKMWPKLPLGGRVTDFVFQEASGDYLLVELERSTHRLFLQDGGRSKELRHAQDQVLDWKRYLEDNLSTVQRELGLTGISSNPRSLIVIGRSRSLTAETRRKLVTMENESPKTRILTYDDLLASTKAVVENLLGPLWQEVGNTEIYYLPGT